MLDNWGRLESAKIILFLFESTQTFHGQMIQHIIIIIIVL